MNSRPNNSNTSPSASTYSTEVKVQFPEESADSQIRDVTLEQNLITYRLPKLQAAAFACVLEEIIDQLNILSTVGELPKVHTELGYKSLEERFGVDMPERQIFDRETIESYEKAIYRQRFVKFQKDRSYVEKILTETMDDLVKHNSYYSLIKRVDECEREKNEEKLLLDEAAKHQQELEKLNFIFESERQLSRTDLKKVSDVILRFKEKYEDIIFDNAVNMNYINNWENARKEQNDLTLNAKEGIYLREIEEAETNINQEIRINAEVESFLRETQKDHEDSIEKWMERYDKEIEARDTQIQILKEEREEQFNELQLLSQTYEEHKLELNEYQELQEQKRLEYEHFLYQTKYAIKIQAWWRGTMYRKKLGPWRPKKGKGKGKGKKKK